jgi:transaldolase
MVNNPLKTLESLGQSIWLDYIRRDLITGGELKRLIDGDGLKGMTSNPAIFEKALAESHDYDADIKEMEQKGFDSKTIYESFSRRDVQMSADEFRQTYESTAGGDGYVSLEVNPHLAHDTKGTVEEARRLWTALDRPNVLIKVPATAEGLPAIKQLISEGININVTLLFGLPRYRQVALAYISGLEQRLSQGKPINKIASVASFFLSRIDTLVDPILENIIAKGGKRAQTAGLVTGQTAIASAKMAYRTYREIFYSSRFSGLDEKGAAVQRVLWASTATKNPKYSDVKYIEPLIGPETINTLPVETLNAYRDHGNPQPSLEKDTEQSAAVLEKLKELDIDIDAVTQQLEDEGVDKFNKPFDKMINSLGQRNTK